MCNGDTSVLQSKSAILGVFDELDIREGRHARDFDHQRQGDVLVTSFVGHQSVNKTVGDVSLRFTKR